MHTNSVIKKLLRIEKIVIENMYFDNANDEEIFIVKVRPIKRGSPISVGLTYREE